MVEEIEWVQEIEVVVIVKYNVVIVFWVVIFQVVNVGLVIKIVDMGVVFNEVLDNLIEYGLLDVKCWNGDGVLCLWFNDYYLGIEINWLVVEEVVEVWDGSFFEGKVCIEQGVMKVY